MDPPFNEEKLKEHGYNPQFPLWSYFTGRDANKSFIGWSGTLENVPGTIWLFTLTGVKLFIL